MFNRRVLSVIFLLCLTLGQLWWSWRMPAGKVLPAEGPQVLSTNRLTMPLSGVWDSFSSLRQAWTSENDQSFGQGRSNWWQPKEQVFLPSSTRFEVAARRFRIPGEWSARTMLLVMSGVEGHANIYLNGVDSLHQIGEFDGAGGVDTLEIPAAAFRYGSDNILLIQLTAGAQQRLSIFAASWPKFGVLTGDIYLEGVVQATLTSPQINVIWRNDSADLLLQTQLVHHGFSDPGPWTVTAVLSDGSAGIAEQTITVNPDESPVQSLNFKLNVPAVHRWSLRDPYLYKLYLKAENTKGDQDDLSVGLGLRTLDFTGSNWKLNGEVIPVKGIALSPEQQFSLRQAGKIESWLTEQQRQGINLVYFVGSFPDNLWLQAADRIGIGMWAELPVAFVPEFRLPKPVVFKELIDHGNLHPSLWAWTVGKEIDPVVSAGTEAYLKGIQSLVQPNPAFVMQLKTSSLGTFPRAQTIMVQEGNIETSWGRISTEDQEKSAAQWPLENKAALSWAFLAVIVIWFNFRAQSWRYKEIGTQKPKRRLRKAWFWHGIAVLARAGTWAGIITSILFQAPTGLGRWFPHLWPGLEVLQVQSPWLIWAGLGLALVLLRLLQVGVVAPHLPESPHPLGLVYWLERRYRWIALVAVLWPLIPYGIPLYILPAAYVGLTLLFLPLRIHDVHRVGGRYAPFLLVPGILGLAAVGWGVYHWPDWLFLWHYVRQ